ncbi:helix-turn-helix domain-containing protein [Candidatus Saccharibacteria bacterium]|nr:helix-turn-helix domain-containing protein [Candidatus Saccharibacteria bacterium]
MSDEVKLVGKVGPQLKARRQALRLSLAQVELDTKIRGKFLTALESGNYDKLPHDIYSRGFVQQYAGYLGLNGSEVATAYVAERGGLEAGDTKRPTLERQRRLVFTGPILAAFAAIVVVSAIASYLVYQFSALAAPPHLVVTSPAADTTVTGSVIEVVGHTTPGADITINNSPILSDTDGSFSEKVALGDGLNTIRVSSKSKLGKSSTVVRNVLAHLPEVQGATASVPTAPFNGVAASISVSATTSVVVAVDGKEAFRQTVLPGWSQLFTGAQSVVITTGNAGATNVVITNSVVANKKFTPLGGQGEIRRNQEFDSTTTFQ